jgi:hypothetical protein
LDAPAHDPLFSSTSSVRERLRMAVSEQSFPGPNTSGANSGRYAQ